MKVKEIKTMDIDRLMRMINNNNWYNIGSTNDFKNLFKQCKGKITSNKLYKITKDIYEHTDMKDAYNPVYLDEKDDEKNILNMMIYINECTFTFFYIPNSNINF